jgi:hypothetical protein
MSKIADDDLKTEEREANPYSETVTLKLSVTPQVKALVTWGAKQVARLSPGSMDAEISRPRGSGPVDLEIKAEGFMPSHTRLYADRNDKIGVRLYRVEEAPGIFGYKRAAEKKVEKSVEKKQGDPRATIHFLTVNLALAARAVVLCPSKVCPIQKLRRPSW